MNFHVLERVTTRVAVVAVATAGGIGATVEATVREKVEPLDVILILGGFLVAFVGALAFAFVRWLGRVGQNVPRDPARTEAQLAALSARVAYLEGQLSQLAVVVPEGRGGG